MRIVFYQREPATIFKRTSPNAGCGNTYKLPLIKIKFNKLIAESKRIYFNKNTTNESQAIINQQVDAFLFI